MELIDYSQLKKIEIDENIKLDHSSFDQLFTLLKRIGRSEQKTSQIIELLRDEFSGQIESSRDLVDNVRHEKNKVKKDIDSLEKGMLEYFDIISAFKKAAETFEDKTFLDAAKVAIKASEQINSSLGIQLIPSDPGQSIDPKYHYVVKSIHTNEKSKDSTINKTLEHGYRRGDKILRLASVIVNVFKEIEK